MSNVYESKHPLVAHKLSRMRDKNTNPKKFREFVREIAALVGVTERAVMRIIHELVEAGFLDIEKSGLLIGGQARFQIGVSGGDGVDG